MLPIEIIIRKAAMKDVPRMVELWKELEAHHEKHFGYGKGLFEYKKNRVKLYRKYLGEQIRARNAAVFVAELTGVIVGHIMVVIKKLPPIYVHDREAYIGEIFVEKDHRKKGIGKKLLDAAEAWAKSKKLYSLGLTVHVKNKNAYSVYKKFGCKEHHLKMGKIIK